MKSILLILCLLACGVSWGCDEDDLDDFNYPDCAPYPNLEWRCK